MTAAEVDRIHAVALGPGCQRWRSRRVSYRPAGEPFDPRRHAVVRVDEREAKAFVQRHHYSHSWPACRLTVGLMRRGRSQYELAGVAAFSVPMTNAVLRAHLDASMNNGIELGRFVLLDEVEANSESWFASRARRVLRDALSIERVLAFCDPIERTSVDGRVVKRGHHGTVYRATNARFGGRAGARTLALLPNGTVLSDRAQSKLRQEERGIEYVCRQIADAGGPERAVHETGPAFLERVRASGTLRRFRHPGNLVFTWGVSAGRRS